MAMGSLTACVLLPAAPDRYREFLQDLERLMPVVLVPTTTALARLADRDAGGDVCPPEYDDLDPAALWQASLSRVRTPWALLLVAGEQLQVPSPALLTDALERADGPLDPWRRGPALLVPDPVAWAAPRLVPAGTTLDWSVQSLRPHPGSETMSVLLTERPRSVPLAEAESNWLKAVISRRTRTSESTTSDASVLDATALTWAGEHDSALVRAGHVLELVTAGAQTRELAARVGVAAGLGGGRLQRAVHAARVWAQADPGNPEAVSWGALAALATGDSRTVRELTDTLDGRDAPDPWLCLGASAPALSAGVKSGIEADHLLDLLRTTPIERFTAQTLMRIAARWHDAGRPAAGLIAAWPMEARPALQWMLEESPLGIGPWWLPLAEEWSRTSGISTPVAARVLAGAAQVDDETALRWTVLMREQGAHEVSPLRERATSASLSPRARVLSAALCLEVFGDEEARPILVEMAAAVPLDELKELLLVLDELAPSAIPVVVEHAASGPGRTVYVADLLEEFGAVEQAQLLRESLVTG